MSFWIYYFIEKDILAHLDLLLVILEQPCDEVFLALTFRELGELPVLELV